MSRFRNYVTDIAFRLTLGKTHITAMVAVKQAEVFGSNLPSHLAAPHHPGRDWPKVASDLGLWVGAIHQLEHRGLVEALPIYKTASGHFAPGAEIIQGNTHRPFCERYKLTEEGQAVWRLLVLAELVQDIEKPRRQRRAA